MLTFLLAFGVVFALGWLVRTAMLKHEERKDLHARDEWAKAYQRRNGVQ